MTSFSVDRVISGIIRTKAIRLRLMFASLALWEPTRHKWAPPQINA